jgi:hypothetical protein
MIIFSFSKPFYIKIQFLDEMGKEAENKSKNKKVKNKTKKSTKTEIKEKSTKQAEKTQTKEKTSSFSRPLRYIVPLIILVLIIVVLWVAFTPDVTAEEVKAQLIIDTGDVQVKSEGGVWTTAENGMDLYESDSIKTGDDTSASIILFKTSIIRLDNNTEVTIEKLIQDSKETSVEIEQSSGRTWNTVSKISGIDNYEVQTPTTVASVRGTSFGVYYLADGNISVAVANGTVNVTTYIDGEPQFSIEVEEYLSLTVDPKKPGKKPKTEPVEEDEWFEENQEKDEDLVSDLKEEIYMRIGPFLPEVRELFGGPTDEELEALIDGYILGYWTLPEDTPEWARKLFEFK